MRSMPASIQVALSMTLATSATQASFGSFQWYFSKPSWESAAGPHSFIDFVQPAPMFITNQYEALGVLFPEGDDNVGPSSTGSTTDGWVLVGGGGPGTGSTITIKFIQPVYSAAFDLPGGFDFKVFSGGQQVYQSIGLSPFSGIVSTEAFDTIVCSGGVTIDNLYFGPPIPAPGAVSVMAVAALVGRGRRRR